MDCYAFSFQSFIRQYEVFILLCQNLNVFVLVWCCRACLHFSSFSGCHTNTHKRRGGPGCVDLAFKCHINSFSHSHTSRTEPHWQSSFHLVFMQFPWHFRCECILEGILFCTSCSPSCPPACPSKYAIISLWLRSQPTPAIVARLELCYGGRTDSATLRKLSWKRQNGKRHRHQRQWPLNCSTLYCDAIRPIRQKNYPKNDARKRSEPSGLDG